VARARGRVELGSLPEGVPRPYLDTWTHALELVKNGQLQRDNMRQELITRGELMTQLREQGVERLDQVKSARIEGDGRVSVIKTDGGEDQPDRQPRPGVE